MKNLLLPTFLALFLLASYACSDKKEDENPAEPYLKTAPNSLTFTAVAETKTIAVSSNVEWTVSSSDNTWCMPLKTAGSNSGNFDIRVAANTLHDSRSATVTVSSAETAPVSIIVSQAGTAPVLSALPTEIAFTSAAAGSALVSVLSNVEWTVSSSDNTWCMPLKTKGSNNGDFDIRVTDNGLYEMRAATITISSTQTPPVYIAVSQKGLPDEYSRYMDSLALVAFYNAAKPKSLGWNFAKPMNTWQGVRLNKQGRVDTLAVRFTKTEIPFYNGGTLAPELGNLTQLETLVIYTDGLTGAIPKEIGNLRNLKELNFTSLDKASGNLTGSIPKELGQLNKLQQLYIIDQGISGTIPAEIGNMTNLRQLVIEGNSQLGGSIPSAIGNLSNLTDLALDYNNLTGLVPKELGRLKQLNYMWLYNNALEGALPDELSGLAKLSEFRVDNNKLTALPPNFTNLSSLQYLSASNNLIEGTLPNNMNKLSKLMELNLQNNKLSGEIPASLTQLREIIAIALDKNKFSGSIPAFGATSQFMKILLFSNNQLTGTIPASIANCPALVVFQVNNNSLSGEIPQAIITKFGQYKVDFCPQEGAGFSNYDCSGVK